MPSSSDCLALALEAWATSAAVTAATGELTITLPDHVLNDCPPDKRTLPSQAPHSALSPPSACRMISVRVQYDLDGPVAGLCVGDGIVVCQ